MTATPADPSTDAAADKPSRPLRALGWMLVAIAAFSLMAVAGRTLQAEMDTFELMLYRSAIGFGVVCGVMAGAPGGFGRARTAHAGLHATRNLFHFTGQNLWFFAVALVPLAPLAALEFTNPIWVAMMAPFLLGERFTRARLAAAALGFAGVLIVAQPGTSVFGAGHAAALAAAICFALNTVFTRRIMAFDDVLCVLFWMTLAQTAMSLPLALPGGVPWPSAVLWPWTVTVALTGLGAHYALTSALSNAPATIVAPMEYLRLPVVAALGALVYGEPLRVAVFVGAAFIIGGNLIGLRAETQGR